MFDVLVYLFENYYRTETYPDQDTLERKLHAAASRTTTSRTRWNG